MRLMCVPMLLLLAGCGAFAQTEAIGLNDSDPVLDGPAYADTDVDNMEVPPLENFADRLEDGSDDGYAASNEIYAVAPAPPPSRGLQPRASGLSEMAAAMEKVLAAPPRKSLWTYLQTGLRSLKGKSQQTAFNRIGYPDRKTVIGAATIYHWETSTPNLDGSMLHCKVKVVARAGVVVDTDFDGNAGACERYARRFGYTK